MASLRSCTLTAVLWSAGVACGVDAHPALDAAPAPSPAGLSQAAPAPFNAVVGRGCTQTHHDLRLGKFYVDAQAGRIEAAWWLPDATSAAPAARATYAIDTDVESPGDNREITGTWQSGTNPFDAAGTAPASITVVLFARTPAADPPPAADLAEPAQNDVAIVSFREAAGADVRAVHLGVGAAVDDGAAFLARWDVGEEPYAFLNFCPPPDDAP